MTFRCLQLLFNYLKNDPQVYGRFRPNKYILEKMRIPQLLTSASPDEKELALDFASFLLRYHRKLDYEDFSEDVLIQNTIKRAEIFRSWADIEDLASGFDSVAHGLEDHKMTAANAFKELYTHMERFKKELQLKQKDCES
mmetsp:Transcript_1260/g.1305  ORF Transcript_1260/g.1305 Transcript_1260/m.1305 type:complete len:140 (+) Transcript_1260:275-694(+)